MCLTADVWVNAVQKLRGLTLFEHSVFFPMQCEACKKTSVDLLKDD